MLSQVLADSKHWQIQEDEQKAHSLPSRTGEIQEHDAYASARIQVGCMKTSKMLPPPCPSPGAIQSGSTSKSEAQDGRIMNHVRRHSWSRVPGNAFPHGSTSQFSLSTLSAGAHSLNHIAPGICMHTYMHTHIHIHVCVYIYKDILALALDDVRRGFGETESTHIYIYTHIHTYIYTYARTHPWMSTFPCRVRK